MAIFAHRVFKFLMFVVVFGLITISMNYDNYIYSILKIDTATNISAWLFGDNYQESIENVYFIVEFSISFILTVAVFSLFYSGLRLFRKKGS